MTPTPGTVASTTLHGHRPVEPTPQQVARNGESVTGCSMTCRSGPEIRHALWRRLTARVWRRDGVGRNATFATASLDVELGTAAMVLAAGPIDHEGIRARRTASASAGV
jgi:hypothetical protein